MASRYYGLNVGQTEFQVTEGASTGSTDMEVRVDLTKLNGGNIEVMQFLDQIKNWLSGKSTRVA